MGEWFQAVADRDATEENAPALATTIYNWLVGEGIISGAPRDCVLGSDVGYPPGPHYEKAVSEPFEGILTLRTNGLEIFTKRTVFACPQGPPELVCSACSARCEPPDAWSAAINNWYSHGGPGLLTCPRCENVRSIADWEHDPPWAFANLGFEFWNWPPMTAEFVQAIGTRLGHRVVLVAGKL
jgi:hypothetical protein